MILNSDLILYHPLWEKADNFFCNKDAACLFNRLVDIYLIACAIGIKEDKIVTEIQYPLENPKSIGRHTYISMQNSDLSDALQLMLQNALINTKTINLDLDERLKLAFDPEYNANKLSASALLNGFANYGIEQIFEHVTSESSLTAIDQLHKYLETLVDFNYEQILNNITLDDLKNIIKE